MRAFKGLIFIVTLIVALLNVYMVYLHLFTKNGTIITGLINLIFAVLLARYLIKICNNGI